MICNNKKTDNGLKLVKSDISHLGLVLRKSTKFVL